MEENNTKNNNFKKYIPIWIILIIIFSLGTSLAVWFLKPDSKPTPPPIYNYEGIKKYKYTLKFYDELIQDSDSDDISVKEQKVKNYDESSDTDSLANFYFDLTIGLTINWDNASVSVSDDPSTFLTLDSIDFKYNKENAFQITDFGAKEKGVTEIDFNDSPDSPILPEDSYSIEDLDKFSVDEDHSETLSSTFIDSNAYKVVIKDSHDVPHYPLINMHLLNGLGTSDAGLGLKLKVNFFNHLDKHYITDVFTNKDILFDSENELIEAK